MSATPPDEQSPPPPVSTGHEDLDVPESEAVK